MASRAEQLIGIALGTGFVYLVAAHVKPRFMASFP
jgi:hypothetical protein